MQQSRHRRGSAVALVAACALVLQTFFSAWAAGAMPAAPTLDIFGNPLCITSFEHDASGPVGDHSAAQNCCAFGCSAASPLPVPPPGAGLPQLSENSDLPAYYRERILIVGPEHDPGSPRAPPVTA